MYNNLLLQTIKQELKNRFKIEDIEIENNKLEFRDIEYIDLDDKELEENVTYIFSYKVDKKGRVIFILDVLSNIFESKQYKEHTLNNIMLRYNYGDNAYIE